MTRLRTMLLIAILGGCLAFACEDDQTVTPIHTPRHSETGGETFAVGGIPSIWIDDFVGGITINPGDADSVRVNYTKRAPKKSDLPRLAVSMTQVVDTITVIASNPDNINNASVDLSVATPSGSELALRAGVGSIKSFIRPAGVCSLAVGAGNILLQLPGDIGAVVHLATGVGTVAVGFTVDGTVTPMAVDGTIGAGDEVEIWAQVAVGNITIIRQTPFERSDE